MRIVIAEDSALLRAGIERILTDAGHDVVAGVPDATNLLRLVNDERPDLAIVDVRMPPTFTDEGIGRPRCCAARTRIQRCWCCRTTSRNAMPPS